MGTRCFILEELTQMWEDLGKRREGSEGAEKQALWCLLHTLACVVVQSRACREIQEADTVC